MLPARKKELWENLVVVWPDAMTNARDWYITHVINHNASVDPAAPKYVTHDEIVTSALREDAIRAGSKQEALLKYVASGHAGTVWYIEGVDLTLDADSCEITRRYRLVKEEF